ncbi:DnaJ domain-containing protein [Haloferax namakaokahaiae]|uniref:DnaJ domain-containing protein n=1 Tax=Haloferax namakaokahaiae TaxID=1748331 RepID=A0ABD5ZAM6_9EURY
MDRDRLVLGLAAVFAGLTMLLVVLAFVYQPFLLAVALPFGATTYFMYSSVSGRLAEQFERERVRADEFGGFGARRQRETSTGGFGAGPRGDPREGPGAGRYRNVGEQEYRYEYQRRQRPPQSRNGMNRDKALRTLGLDADATQADIKDAYRRLVKETHPDSKSGDQEAFKRVSKAYERLSE